jgi:hypothetical protein
MAIDTTNHRVGKVRGFFFIRRNWDSPTPSFWGGGGTLACGRGRGGPNFDEGIVIRHCGTLDIYCICTFCNKLRYSACTDPA